MTIRKILLATSAIALAAAPMAAAATGALKSAQPVTDESEFGSMETRFLIGGILAAGLAILIIADDDDDEPTSP